MSKKESCGEDENNQSGKSHNAQNAAIADNATERELLREIAKGIGVIADRVESVRRTLWRIGEVRAYENKGAAADRKPEAAEGGEE